MKIRQIAKNTAKILGCTAVLALVTAFAWGDLLLLSGS